MSIPKDGRSVNNSARAARDTVTFEPYYWEAYNEIVQPRLWDRYLIRRWLRETIFDENIPGQKMLRESLDLEPGEAFGLGDRGFTIVKVLRDHLWINKETGDARDEIDDLDMDALSAACAVSRRSLQREFTENKSLRFFIRKSPTFNFTQSGTLVRKTKNTYKVAMDDPIHPLDQEWYETLREEKERQRLGEQGRLHGTVRIKDRPFPLSADEGAAHTRQYGAYGESTGTRQYGAYGESTGTRQYGAYGNSGTRQYGAYGNSGTRQNCRPPGQNCTESVNSVTHTRHIGATYNDDLPLSTLHTSDTATLSPSQNCDPPRGIGEEDVFGQTWNTTLTLLKDKVNTATFETHMRSLRIVTIEENTVQIEVPSPFTRDWVEKRHSAVLHDVLSEVLGRTIEVSFVVRKGLK